MAIAIDLRPYAGKWIAQDYDGEVIASAGDLVALERHLIKEGYTEDDLPQTRFVPEEGICSFLL
jgi:hypothetical protein